MKIDTSRVTELSVSSTEPVSRTEAKLHLRVDITDDDTLIDGLITAARQYCEQYCNRSFVSHTFRADLPYFWDMMTLPLGPVQSITHVKYYDTSSPSTLQTLSSSVYALSYDTVYRNHGASWESVYPRVDAVQVTYQTGWQDSSSPEGTGAAVPKAVEIAIKLFVADMYENREASVIGVSRTDNPTAHLLLNPYRNYQ